MRILNLSLKTFLSFLHVSIFIVFSLYSYSQQLDEQEILEGGEVNIIGATHTDPQALKVVTGLKTGERFTMPDDIQEAFNNLWEFNLFSDIRSIESQRIDNLGFMDIHEAER